MKSKPNLQSYLKYSGMAFQFFAVLALAAWFGKFMDSYFENAKPIVTVLCIAAAFIMMLIWLNYSLKKNG